MNPCVTLDCKFLQSWLCCNWTLWVKDYYYTGNKHTLKLREMNADISKVNPSIMGRGGKTIQEGNFDIPFSWDPLQLILILRRRNISSSYWVLGQPQALLQSRAEGGPPEPPWSDAQISSFIPAFSKWRSATFSLNLSHFTRRRKLLSAAFIWDLVLAVLIHTTWQYGRVRA